MAARSTSAIRRGATLLVLDELSPRPDWWNAFVEELGSLDPLDQPLRVSIERPLKVKAMDKAARLDHQVLALRALVAGPPARGEAAR